MIVNHQNLFFVSEKELSHAENALLYLLSAHTSVHSIAFKNFSEKGSDRFIFAFLESHNVHSLLSSSFPFAQSMILLHS